MKRFAPAALALLLCSCQTTSYEPPVRDYAALAAAAVGKYTIDDNNVYGLRLEGKLDPGFQVLESRKEGPWSVDKVVDKSSGFDNAEVTTDETGAIVRIRFFKTTHTDFGRQDAYNSIYQTLKAKYKAVQVLGDLDTSEMTVNVADGVDDWKQHYIEYLQLMDEPNNLGAQFCWILHPHLSVVSAVFHREANGTTMVLDFQTKRYAAALKAKAAPAPASANP